MEQPNNEFLKGLSSGTVANLIFAVGFLIYRICSTKCKHSKCKSKTKCLECSTQEDSFNSKQEENELKIRSQFEENLQDLLGKLTKSLRKGGSEIIRSNTERQGSGLNRLVVEEGAEGQV